VPEGVGRRVAFHAGYESYVAEVAEVTLENGRRHTGETTPHCWYLISLNASKIRLF
jgi:hypothetical protein